MTATYIYIYAHIVADALLAGCGICSNFRGRGLQGLHLAPRRGTSVLSSEGIWGEGLRV